MSDLEYKSISVDEAKKITTRGRRVNLEPYKEMLKTLSDDRAVVVRVPEGKRGSTIKNHIQRAAKEEEIRIVAIKQGNQRVIVRLLEEGELPPKPPLAALQKRRRKAGK